jgi:adenine-specific DNA-methyltransferase
MPRAESVQRRVGPTLPIGTEADLARIALDLGAASVGGLTDSELALDAGGQATLGGGFLAAIADAIRAGEDPLGDVFCVLRSPEARRPMGATYTPAPIVRSMVDWASDQGTFARVVDPGSGSGRFLLAAAKQFPGAELVAVDSDPLAVLLVRANLAAAGIASRARVVLGDYRALRLDPVEGRTLYLGNPPYVRHHQIGAAWKDWLARSAQSLGFEASTLAGLHVHFFLATAAIAAKDDMGAFITSAEWLDVNYGALVRQLLVDGLGGLAVHVLDPQAGPFEGTATTGAITCFRVGSRPDSIRLRRVDKVADLGRLDGGRLMRRERLIEARRWTPLMRATPKVPAGYVELGELCRVHRGAVTGLNAVWITDDNPDELPDEVLFPSITRARELFAAGRALVTTEALRRVIDLPATFDTFEPSVRQRIDSFLSRAKAAGAADGYIARARRSWWTVGLRPAAPILATYMARRPPAFVRNLAEARHLNIAHGLYPRQPMSGSTLDRLADALRNSVTVSQGRTYAGGLTKFEPKEMERLPVPDLAVLQAT